MASGQEKLTDPRVAGPLGSLALSVVRPGAVTLALRSLRWQRDLERLGLHLPFPIVHDVGMLFAAPVEQLAVGPRADLTQLLGRVPGGVDVARDYLSLIRELATSEAARRAGSLRMSDDMVAVVLSRILGTVSERMPAATQAPTTLVADASLFEQAETQLGRLFWQVDRTTELRALGLMRELRLRVLTLADALDLDTLRLLGVLGAEGAAGGSIQVDLLAALSSPSANDVVNFSLEILPSVLETKRRPGLTTRAGQGYGGIGTRGDLDSLVLTELAWDSDDFIRRVLDNEVLYYAKESVPELAGRRHLLLIDASASMRGDRQVFARGMALATAKKLVIQDEEVTFRFFDARLYEPFRSVGGNLPTAHVLSFQGERGRNPSRVFAELATVLDVEAARDRREVVIHVFTHAAMHLPRSTVEAVGQRSRLGMVFILPSGGKLALDYLDLLDAHWVVDHATLVQRDARATRARDILGEIGTRRGESTMGRAP